MDLDTSILTSILTTIPAITLLNQVTDYSETQENQSEKPLIFPQDLSTAKTHKQLIEYSHANIENNSDIEVLFEVLKQQEPNSKIVYVTNIDDLRQADLLKRELIQKGEFIEQEGELLTQNQQPKITLVVDFRRMTAEERMSLNSLYSNPISVDKYEVKANIEIVSVIDYSLISGQNPTNKDFWRRISLSKNAITIENKQHLQHSCVDNSNTDIYTNSDFFNRYIHYFGRYARAGSTVIDFNQKNWRNQLFGYKKIQQDGSILFMHSKLKDIKADEPILLKNAPWDDYSFRNSLRSIIEANEYIANGETVKLASNITWQQQESQYLSTDSCIINKTFTRTNKSILNTLLDNKKNVSIINDDLWAELFSTNKIDDSRLVTTDVFVDFISDAKAILITSDISFKQKLQLFSKLKELNKSTIPIYILNADDKELIATPQEDSQNDTLIDKTVTNPNIKINIEITDKNITQSSKTTNDIQDDDTTNEIAIFQVSSDSNLNNLCTTTTLENFTTKQFKVEKQSFLKVLEGGKPFKLIGLENNKLLANQLITLLGYPSRLIINGNIHEFKNIDMTIVLPKDKKLASPLWRYLAQTHIAKKVNLEQIKSFLTEKYTFAKQHPDISNKMADQLKELICLINSTPKGEFAPKAQMPINANVFSLVWDEVEFILQKNPDFSPSVDIWLTAVKTVLLSRFAGNNEVYCFFNVLAKYYFSEGKPSTFFNEEKIKDWIKNNGEITSKLVEKNIWQLLSFMPDCKYLLKNKQLKMVTSITVKKILFKFFNCIANGVIILIGFARLSSILSFIIYLVISLFLVIALNIFLTWYFNRQSIFERPEYLDEQPKSAPVSLNKNDTYLKLLEIVKTTLVSCAAEDEKLPIQKSLKVSTHNLKIVKNCRNNWKNIDSTVTETLKYMLGLFSQLADNNQANEVEIIKDVNLFNAIVLEITELKTKYNKAVTEEEVNNITTDLLSILTEILPASALTKKQIITEIFLENNELTEEAKEFLYELSQEYKISTLCDAVKTHKINFFIGYTGAGKSHTAEKVAKRLNPNVKTFIVNANKELSTNNLFGNNIPHYNADGSVEIKYKKGVVQQWLETTSNQPIPLIIEEANLSDPNIWNLFKTIYAPTPHIFHHGNRINLSPNHLVIMTGNPDSKHGRITNDFVKERANIVYFDQLPAEFQRKIIIEKQLSNIIESTGILKKHNKKQVVAQLSKTILSLYKQYEAVLPTHPFTPRDLTDCCSYILFFLKHNEKAIAAEQITIPMLNEVIYVAMYQAIGDKATTKDSWRISAINCWYRNNYVTDATIMDYTKQQFEDFIDELILKYHGEQATNAKPLTAEHELESQFDFSNSLTQQIAYPLYLKYETLRIEKETNYIFQGRRIFGIVGEAGTGKDKLLNLISRFYKDKYNDDKIKLYNINAGSRSEIQIREDVEDAYNNGYAITFSEINRLSSGVLEGTLNDIATQQPKTPGFNIFFTENPTNYSGRQDKSLALQSRITSLCINDFSQNDLAKIINNTLKDKKTSDILAALHCKLIADFKKHHLPQVPSVDHLIEAAKALGDKDKTTENIVAEFKTAYYFFLTIANDYINPGIWSTEAISKQISSKNTDEIHSIQGYNQNITRWLLNNFATQLNDTVYVMLGSKDTYDAKRNYIFLSQETLSTSEEEQKKVVIKLFLDYLWETKYAGLTDCPIQYSDKASATYKKWQQSFAESILQTSTEVKELTSINTLYPLNDKEEKLFNSLGAMRQLLLQALFKLKPNASNIKKMDILISSTAADKELLSLANNLISNDATILELSIKDDSNLTQKLLDIALTNNKLTTDYIQKLLNIVGNHDANMLNQVLVYLQQNISSPLYSTKDRQNLIEIIEYARNYNYAQQTENKTYIDSIIKTAEQLQDNPVSEASNSHNNTLVNNSTKTANSNNINKSLIQIFKSSDSKSGFTTKNLAKPLKYLKEKITDTQELFIDYYEHLKSSFIDRQEHDPLIRAEINYLLKSQKNSYGIRSRLLSGFSLKGEEEDLNMIRKQNHYKFLFQKTYRKELSQQVKNKLEGLSIAEKDRVDPKKNISTFVNNMTSKNYKKYMDNSFAACDLISSEIPEFVELGLDIIISANISLSFDYFEWSVISRTLLSKVLDKDKIFAFIKKIESKDFVLSPEWMHLFKIFYSYLLKFSLENLKNNKNQTLSLDVINYILNKKDFFMYLNGASTNYLLEICKEIDMPDITCKIQDILDNHYKACIDKDSDVIFKREIVASSFDYMDRAMIKIISEANTSCPHIETQMSSAKPIVTYSLNPSNVIDIAKLSQKQPFYESKSSDAIKPDVYISGFPFIQNMESMTVIYDSSSKEKFISLSPLITGENSKKLSSLFIDNPLDAKQFDKNKEIREIVKNFLQTHGYEIVTDSQVYAIYKICYTTFMSRYKPLENDEVLTSAQLPFIYIQPKILSQAFFQKILKDYNIVFCVVAENTGDAGVYKVGNIEELDKLHQHLLSKSSDTKGGYFGLTTMEHCTSLREYEKIIIKELHNIIDEPILTGSDLNIAMTEFIKSLHS